MKQLSPFAALTGAEKQIRWLEYQSIKLPYVETSIAEDTHYEKQTMPAEKNKTAENAPERPQPPPEVPRVMTDALRARHSQYDAVIARMKQAELYSKKILTQATE